MPLNTGLMRFNLAIYAPSWRDHIASNGLFKKISPKTRQVGEKSNERLNEGIRKGIITTHYEDQDH